MPRYLPVQIDAASEPVKQVYADVQQKLSNVPNFIKTLAHNDRILRPIAESFLTLVRESSLSEKTRLLVMLRVVAAGQVQAQRRSAHVLRQEGRVDRGQSHSHG